MKYLEAVQSGRVMSAIIAESESNDFEVLQSDRHKVKVKSGCLPVDISWEMCSCHGGRMWFNQDNTNIHIELSSSTYDTENGIIDPETELAWYIENRLADTVRRFQRFVHIVEFEGRYSDGGKERLYLDNVDIVSQRIFEEDGHNVFSEYDEVIHQYPNPDMQLRVKHAYDKDNKIYFDCTRLSKNKETGEFEITRKYTACYWVFRK